ncbi:MAG TPA: hypothetical protein VMU67_05270 [Steroidobacteraceae bacterium]|nr:hypothetical protein [Steroidobacteraceae bacterium]
MHGLAEWLQASSLSNTIQAVSWMIPLLQSVHIATIGVVFVSSLMIALRVLGLKRADDPFDAVWRRFAPWMWTGLLVMATTGTVLIVAEPVREMSALSFWLKMLLVATGAASTALHGRALRSAARVAPAKFSVAAKAGSVLIVILWLAVIFLGRAIAYDKEVWGSLSLHA